MKHEEDSMLYEARLTVEINYTLLNSQLLHLTEPNLKKSTNICCQQ